MITTLVCRFLLSLVVLLKFGQQIRHSIKEYSLGQRINMSLTELFVGPV